MDNNKNSFKIETLENGINIYLISNDLTLLNYILNNLKERKIENIEINLKNISKIDIITIGLLETLVKDYNKNIKIYNTNETISNVLTLTGTDKIIKILQTK